MLDDYLENGDTMNDYNHQKSTYQKDEAVLRIASQVSQRSLHNNAAADSKRSYPVRYNSDLGMYEERS